MGVSVQISEEDAAKVKKAVADTLEVPAAHHLLSSLPAELHLIICQCMTCSKEIANK